MIDRHETVFAEIINRTEGAISLDVVHRNFDKVAVRTATIPNYRGGIALGFVARRDFLRRLDKSNGTALITDLSVEPPVTRWLVDASIGRLAGVSEGGVYNFVGQGIRRDTGPFEPVDSEAGSAIVRDMAALLDDSVHGAYVEQLL